MVGKAEGNRPFWRHTLWCLDNIKIFLKCGERTLLILFRWWWALLNVIIDFRVLQISGNLLTFWAGINFPWRIGLRGQREGNETGNETRNETGVFRLKLLGEIYWIGTGLCSILLPILVHNSLSLHKWVRIPWQIIQMSEEYQSLININHNETKTCSFVRDLLDALYNSIAQKSYTAHNPQYSWYCIIKHSQNGKLHDIRRLSVHSWCSCLWYYSSVIDTDYISHAA